METPSFLAKQLLPTPFSESTFRAARGPASLSGQQRAHFLSRQGHAAFATQLAERVARDTGLIKKVDAYDAREYLCVKAAIDTCLARNICRPVSSAT